nr:hypothetical protein [Rothia mucilaginosa]
MATTLNTVARSNLRASKGKYVLTGIGIAISSFFIAAIMMLTNSLQATVNSSVGDVLSRAEAVVASAATTSDGRDSTSIYLTRDQIQKVEKSDLLSGYWVQYAVTGKLGCPPTLASSRTRCRAKSPVVTTKSWSLPTSRRSTTSR